MHYYMKMTIRENVCKSGWEREKEKESVVMNVIFDLLIQIIASGIPRARKQIDLQQNKKITWQENCHYIIKRFFVKMQSMITIKTKSYRW